MFPLRQLRKQAGTGESQSKRWFPSLILPGTWEVVVYQFVLRTRKLGFRAPALGAQRLRATKGGKFQALCPVGRASPGALMQPLMRVTGANHWKYHHGRRPKALGRGHRRLTLWGLKEMMCVQHIAQCLVHGWHRMRAHSYCCSCHSGSNDKHMIATLSGILPGDLPSGPTLRSWWSKPPCR